MFLASDSPSPASAIARSCRWPVAAAPLAPLRLSSSGALTAHNHKHWLAALRPLYITAAAADTFAAPVLCAYALSLLCPSCLS